MIPAKEARRTTEASAEVLLEQLKYAAQVAIASASERGEAVAELGSNNASVLGRLASHLREFGYQCTQPSHQRAEWGAGVYNFYIRITW